MGTAQERALEPKVFKETKHYSVDTPQWIET